METTGGKGKVFEEEVPASLQHPGKLSVWNIALWNKTTIQNRKRETGEKKSNAKPFHYEYFMDNMS